MAAPDCRAGGGRRFPHAAHLHTQVVSLQQNGHSVRMQHGFHGIRDLLPDPLLHREAFGEKPHQAGKFGDADDIFS